MDAPRYYFFAPLDSGVGGPIALGSIIEAPKFADSPLNTTPVVIADSDIIKPPNKSAYHLKIGQTIGGSVGFWADFLGPILGIGGNASIDLKTTKEQDVACDLLETRWFRPSDTYISQGITNSVVKDHIVKNKSWLGKSKLFMITGIKIAHNATFAYNLIKEKGISFHFGVDGTNSGVPLSLGPEADLRNDKSREEGFTIVEPFVMAYRINEIEIKAKTGKVVSNTPFTDGAALGTVPLPGNKEVDLVAILKDSDQIEGAGREWEDEGGELCHFVHS
jgi:hypothetical protein